MDNMAIEEAVETARQIRSGAVDVLADQNQLRAKVRHNGRIGLHLTGDGSSNCEIVGSPDRLPAKNFDATDIELSPTATRQVAVAAGIPIPYWKRCEDSDPQMLVDHVNHWLPQSASRRMVRMATSFYGTRGGTQYGPQYCRAFLSDKYMPVDSADILDQIWRNLHDRSDDSTPWRVHIDEDGLNFSSHHDLLTREVKESQSKVGDIMHGGIRVLNSEVGTGKLVAQLCLYRLVCLNGMTMPIKLGGYARRHIGLSSAQALDELNTAVDAILNGGQFNVAMERIANAVETKMAKDWIAKLVKDSSLSEAEESALLENYGAEENQNLWGASNSITALAHRTNSVGRKTELETLGGNLLTSPPFRYLRAA